MGDALGRFLRDESGGMVDTIVAIAIVVLVTGPVLVILSRQVNDLMERIIRLVADAP